jgi:hypothetical protein
MMHSASIPDAFLDSYIGTNDEVKKRCLSHTLDFGGELDNEMNDVPLQDMYQSEGLVLTQEGRERTNLQLEGGERCGLTGLIPSAEQGLMMGASPKPQGILMALGVPDENQIEMSKKRRGLTR